MAIYTAVFAAVAISAAQDIFDITAGNTTRVRIREMRLNQYSDFGDAQAELISMQVIRGFTTVGSGGSTITPRNVLGHTGAPAAQSVVLANNTTVATVGTTNTMVADAWNVAAGFSLRDILKMAPHRDDQSEELVVERNQRLVFRITAPADALTCNGTLIFEEIGVPPF